MKIKWSQLVFLLLLALFLPLASVKAQVAMTQQQLQDQQAQLQQQLAEIEAQIQQYSKQLTQTQAQKNTLNNKIKQLKIEQSAIQLKIKQTTLQLQKIGSDLTRTRLAIGQNEQLVDGLHKQISEILRQLYITSQQNIVFNMFLYDKGISGFFDDMQSYQSLSRDLHDLIIQAKYEGDKLANQKRQLDDQQKQQQNLLSIASLQGQSLAQNISNQSSLLQQTKGQEAAYQALISNKKKEASQIRARIYELFGTTKQVTFGDAVQIADWVSKQTNVRTAFLLAILTQESNLGKNVGTCNRPGDPPTKSWKVIMKPDRDQQPFLQITSALGLDPDTTPVSCPMRDKNGKQIGWGGAMGPAQFIPSTWLGYKDKVTALTGKSANPWDIRDAFVAAAIKLAADGGTSQSGEWAAAMRYFSGGTNPAYSFYGDNVVALAKQYQSDIDKMNY